MQIPTVGIEVELPWATMLSRVDPEAADILRDSHGFYTLNKQAQNRIKEGFDALDEAYLPAVEDVIRTEPVRRGNDGFAEFAVLPSITTEDQVAVVETLYSRDLLREGEVYPLHVTFGGVAEHHPSWTALMAMEICGGVTPERMLQTRTWARKGKAGILQRRPDELLLGVKEGVEFRTLQLTSPEQLAQILGVGYLACEHVIEQTPEQGQLQDLMVGAMAERGVDASHQWPNPQQNIKPWQGLANCLSQEEWRKQLTDEILSII